MFGYVLPKKCEMRIKDYDIYRSFYCGLCKQLQASYGVFSRMLLNYDLVLLAVTTDCLSGELGETCAEGCFINPIMKRPMRHGTAGLRLAADGLVMLSYHKVRDNLQDEKFLKKIGYAITLPFLKHMYKKAARQNSYAAACIEDEMKRQSALEAAGCLSVDEICDPTAKMCAVLFSSASLEEHEKKILFRLGLFAGQVVYLLDAAEDFDEDKAKGRYNVFVKLNYTKEQAIEAVKRRCRMAAGEVAACYRTLQWKQGEPILDNIFYLGLPAGIDAAGIKRSNGRTQGHGQIEGV
ncbi:MAG: DUF5685 family protein [Oscillospiraceae bacterium]